MLVFVGGCTCGRPPLIPADGGGFQDAGMDAQLPPVDAYMPPPDGGPPPDRGPLDPDAACASQTASAIIEPLPVDIIWMVDNSVSMQPAIEQVQAGLNDFAALIGGRDLDYRVIMLSMRGVGMITSGSERRYQVCIPPPLAGDASCGDGPRFFHVHVDIKSTQPLEQFLGTLGQTAGYVGTGSGMQLGSLPWHDLLRPEATKTIVVVTDDNARFVAPDGSGGFMQPGGGVMGDPVTTVDWFETTAAGRHLFASTRTLPEGILHPRWGGLFDDYIFSGIYGWGSETDDTVMCEFAGGTEPVSPGRTYSELVRRTGGVRAKICDGASAWTAFFEDVATAVERASRVDCTIPIPEAPDGSFFDRTRINVFVDLGEGDERVGKVADPSACDDRGGWHYDDELDPASVILCPATCEALQAAPGETRSVDVQFGCQTIPI